MNKRTKISLTLVLAVMLVILSVGLASAKSVNTSVCIAYWPATDKDGVVVSWYVHGEVEWTLDGSILTKTCKGNIPLGEPIGNSDCFVFSLDEMRDYVWETYGAEVGYPFELGPDETGGSQATNIYQGVELTSYDWSFRVKTNGDFKFVTYFEIE